MKLKFKAAILSIAMALGGNIGGQNTVDAKTTGGKAQTSYCSNGKKKTKKASAVKAQNTNKPQIIKDEDPYSKGEPSKRPYGMRRKGRRPNTTVTVDTIPEASLQFMAAQKEARSNE